MKSLLALAFLVVVGCQSLAAVDANAFSAGHAHAYALWHRQTVVTPVNPVPSMRCGGTGYIKHGDGHRTPCPGCQDCRKNPTTLYTIDEPLLQPAVYTKAVKKTVSKQPCADGACPVAADACECTTSGGACDCPNSGACRDGACGVRSAGSCAAGSCGTASAGSRGPLRRVFGGIRERRPVRRFLGRIFGRGCR